jgi:DNA-binding phage protein
VQRKAKRVFKSVSAEKQAQIKRIREKILREEKAELSAWAKQVLAEMDIAKAELARAAELLQAERQAQNLTLADIEQRTGMSRAALCRLENLRDANPTVGTLEKFAQALGKRLIVGLQD